VPNLLKQEQGLDYDEAKAPHRRVSGYDLIYSKINAKLKNTYYR